MISSCLSGFPKVTFLGNVKHFLEMYDERDTMLRPFHFLYACQVPEHQRYRPHESKDRSWWSFLGFRGSDKTVQELTEEEGQGRRSNYLLFTCSDDIYDY